MKKLLFTYCVILISFHLDAQTIFTHDFTNGIAPMTMVDNDKNIPAPIVFAFDDAWNIIELISPGNKSAASISSYNPAGISDDWLITPSIKISDVGFFFVWDAFVLNPNLADGYEVLVSTTNNELSSFSKIYSLESESGELTTRALDLSAYSGQNIYIAIRNNSNDKFLLVIDNIKITKLKKTAVSAIGLANQTYNLSKSDFFLSFEILNSGSDTLKSLDVIYTFDGQTKTETINGLQIAAFQKGKITLNESAIIPESKDYEVTFEIFNPNGLPDDDISDNLGVGRIVGISNIPERKIVVETGTGTWCGWCPRGNVFMQIMKEKYPEDFIGISVHDSDVMNLAEHFNNLDFKTIPKSHVNRNSKNIDPDRIEVFYNIEKLLHVPFGVEIDINYDDVSREATISAKATGYTNLTDTDFRFSVIITEDNNTSTLSTYNQTNNYWNLGIIMGGYDTLPNPVPASLMVYDDVSRSILGGFSGEEGSMGNSVFDGFEITKTFTFTLPAGQNPGEWRAAVLVVDNSTGVILNADEDVFGLPVSIFNTEVNTIEASIYPNPASDIALVKINIEETSDVIITVMDLTGRTLSSVNYGKAQGVSTFEMNVTDLNAGVYVVNVATDAGVSTQRLTVSK